MKTYKVWIAVELHDDKTDEYTDLTQFGETASFNGRHAERKAEELADKLHNIGLIVTGIVAHEVKQ
jgi:hypothetical protein